MLQIKPLRTIKCCSVVLNIRLRLLIIKISSSSPAVNKLHHLPPAISVTTCHRPATPCWLAGGSVSSVRWSQILAQNRDFCLLHLHSTTSLMGFPSQYCHNGWYWKTRMVWLPDGEKMKICLFVLTGFTNVTDTQTPHDSIGRACITSRGKNALPDEMPYRYNWIAWFRLNQILWFFHTLFICPIAIPWQGTDNTIQLNTMPALLSQMRSNNADNVRLCLCQYVRYGRIFNRSSRNEIWYTKQIWN